MEHVALAVAVFLMTVPFWKIPGQVLLSATLNNEEPITKGLQNENLSQLIRKNEILIKELMNKLTKMEERSDKVEVILPNRNKVTKNEELPLTPIVKFVKKIPIYGKLFVHVIADEIKTQFEPFKELIDSKSEEKVL